MTTQLSMWGTHPDNTYINVLPKINKYGSAKIEYFIINDPFENKDKLGLNEIIYYKTTDGSYNALDTVENCIKNSSHNKITTGDNKIIVYVNKSDDYDTSKTQLYVKRTRTPCAHHDTGYELVSFNPYTDVYQFYDKNSNPIEYNDETKRFYRKINENEYIPINLKKIDKYPSQYDYFAYFSVIDNNYKSLDISNNIVGLPIQDSVGYYVRDKNMEKTKHGTVPVKFGTNAGLNKYNVTQSKIKKQVKNNIIDESPENIENDNENNNTQQGGTNLKLYDVYIRKLDCVEPVVITQQANTNDVQTTETFPVPPKPSFLSKFYPFSGKKPTQKQSAGKSRRRLNRSKTHKMRSTRKRHN